jgi:hypothetical protein
VLLRTQPRNYAGPGPKLAVRFRICLRPPLARLTVRPVDSYIDFMRPETGRNPNSFAIDHAFT